jgi:hypothetical protein
LQQKRVERDQIHRDALRGGSFASLHHPVKIERFLRLGNTDRSSSVQFWRFARRCIQNATCRRGLRGRGRLSLTKTIRSRGFGPRYDAMTKACSFNVHQRPKPRRGGGQV